eukprot:COSAG05_NODE_2198_length_3410_cov_5.345213_1_plen_164_part_00
MLFTAALSDAAPSPWGWEMATGENDVVPASHQSCYSFLGSNGSFSFPGNVLWNHRASPLSADASELSQNVGDWSTPLVSTAKSPLATASGRRAPLGAWKAELSAFLAAVARHQQGGWEQQHEALLADMGLTSGADGLASVAAVEAVKRSVETCLPVAPAFRLR